MHTDTNKLTRVHPLHGCFMSIFLTIKWMLIKILCVVTRSQNTVLCCCITHFACRRISHLPIVTYSEHVPALHLSHWQCNVRRGAQTMWKISITVRKYKDKTETAAEENYKNMRANRASIDKQFFFIRSHSHEKPPHIAGIAVALNALDAENVWFRF